MLITSHWVWSMVSLLNLAGSSHHSYTRGPSVDRIKELSLSVKNPLNNLSQTCSCSGGRLLLRRGGGRDAGKAGTALPEPDHWDVGLDRGVGPGKHQRHGWMIFCLNSANKSSWYWKRNIHRQYGQVTLSFAIITDTEAVRCIIFNFLRSRPDIWAKGKLKWDRDMGLMLSASYSSWQYVYMCTQSIDCTVVHPSPSPFPSCKQTRHSNTSEPSGGYTNPVQKDRKWPQLWDMT